MLGTFKLAGIPPMPAGLPQVDVTFLVNENGMLTVSAREQRSGQQSSVTVQAAHGLSPDEVAYLDRRRWNYGLFRGRYVSIHPTRAEDEITEGYGDRPSSPCGPATIAARVTDVADAGFLPAVYKVADATVEDGPPAAIEEVVVFEALFAGMADPGDRILARGQVEVDAAGRGRLVVGSAAVEGGGTLRVLASAPSRAGPAPG